MKFVKYNNFWWKYDESTPLDKAKLIKYNGEYETDNDITKCEIADSDDLKSLNWFGTEVYNDIYPCGWLDRNGKFYGCDLASHSLQAQLVHHSNSIELEKEGWIHISRDMIYGTGKLVAEFWGDYKNGILPTDKQLLYLSQHSQIDSHQVFSAIKKDSHNNFENEM